MSSKRALPQNTPQSNSIGTSIVTDTLEIRRLLTRAVESRTPATVKLRGSDTPLRTRIMNDEVNPDEIHFEFQTSDGSLNAEKFEELAQTTGTREAMVLIYLQGRSIIGLNAEPSKARKDRLIFQMPSKLFKIQRRKDVRFEIPKGYEFIIEIESIEQKGVIVQKRLLDLSEGGLSFFILSPREAGLFKPGRVLKNCMIHLQSKQIPVELKVANQLGSKIGAQFQDISPDDKIYLAQFIYSRAAHLFY